jgi:photosystem II stability/assembly factor-like uncharacterized protein
MHFWLVSSISFDGRIMAVTGNNEDIHISYDTGVTWHPSRITGAANRWGSIGMSYNGQFMIAVAFGGGGGDMYTSHNAGNTWKLIRPDTVFFTSVAVSNNGKYIVATEFLGSIQSSCDFGGSWQTVLQAQGNYVQAVASNANGTQYILAYNANTGLTVADRNFN